MKSTIPGACRPAGDFENKTSTAPKLGLGLGAELGNNHIKALSLSLIKKNMAGVYSGHQEKFDLSKIVIQMNRLIFFI